MKTIKSCLSVLFVAASVSAFAATVTDAKWGNVGNVTETGVATAIAQIAYSSFTVDFGTTDNISQREIGKSGLVKISKIRLFADNNATAKPTVITISQENSQVISGSCTFVSSQKIYGGLWPTTASHFWTRKAIDATFTSETLFDTSKMITISFDNTTIIGIRPVNSVCASSNYSPAIEITGDYTPNGSMEQELQHHYSFDGDLEAASGQPLTFKDETGDSYVDSGNGQAYKISKGTASPTGTGILQAGEECWTISTFAKLVTTDNAVAWAIGHSTKSPNMYFALTTGTNGQIRVVANPSASDLDAKTLIESTIVVDDRAEKYHLYTITRNNNFTKLYIDGALAGTYMGTVTLPDQQFQLGSVRGGVGNTGLVAGNDICIDEWRLYQGELSADEVKGLSELFPIWPNDNGEDSVSINFIGGASLKSGYPDGQSITDQETAGAVEVAGLNWNQILSDGTAQNIVTNGIALKEVLKNGSTSIGTMTVDVKATNVWDAKGASTPVSGNGRMMYGYLDDGETSDGYGAQITVNNIPYSEYTVYVYMGSDSAYYFLPVYINGTSCPTTAQVWYGSTCWGYASTSRENGSALTLTENSNYIKVSGLTSTTLAIRGSKMGSYTYFRCGIAGIQIVNTGTRQATGGEYVADITATPANWNNGNGTGLAKRGDDWANDNTAAITLTNLTDDATLTFDTAVEAAKVNIVQAADKELTLKATASMAVGAYDVSKSAGKVSFDGSTLGSSVALSGTSAKIIPGGTVEFALGENGAMSVSGNGSANSANIRYALTSGMLTMGASGSTGPFNKSPLTVSGAGTILKFTGVDATGYGSMTNPAFTIEDGAELQVGKRDTLTTPINLKSGTVRMMNGCADNGRGLELFNPYGNNWTIEGSSGFVLDPAIGEAGKRVWLHQGAWNVDVADGGIFNVDVILYGDNNIVKTGAGEMRINGENEYTGTTTISAGRVYAGNPKALGTGAITIAEGAVLEFDLDDFVTITGSVAPFNFADTDSWSRVQANPSLEHPEITYDPKTGKVKLDVSGSGVTGLHISSINPKPKAFDPNGHESSIVYLTNYGPEPVNLKDYKLVRANFGKKVKATDDDIMPLLEHEVESGDTYAVYLSEDYETASDLGGDGKTVKWFGEAMVVPVKVNPKKYPMVRLYNFASETNVIDEVIVPCEIDDDITVEVGLNTNKLVRYVVNGTTRTEIGPDANGPYGVKDLENDIELMNGRGCFVSTTNGFTVTLPVNPLKTGDTVLDANKIQGVRLEYRFFDKISMTSSFADMTKLKKGDVGYDKSYGDQWSYTIPQSELADKAGKLLQYRAIITDGGDATWMAPRFCHPELGYEWYGAVVEPGETVRLENLPTMLMFADSVNLAQMDKDVNDQDKTQVPYNARIAIYDTSTHRYYDNVRIDLRGNTSAKFYKKSHGLRFSKVAPFTTTNPLDGRMWEVRKSSFCTEYADPTYIRQSLSFWLLNKVGSPAPFHYPVRLYLNGEFYQLAFHSERFTDELIEDVYGLNKFVYSYKNIGTFGGGTTGGGIEKKTPDDDNESDLSVLNPYCRRLSDTANGASMTDAQKAAITKTVVTNFDLSAWINYIAIAKITHENDDVWANLSGYINKYDALHNPDGNDLMAPLAYDMNLSFGQWYYGDDSGAGRCGVRPADDQFKSHPLYGGFTIRAHKVNGSEVGNGNRAFEAVFQNEKFRRLYLRRLRTLMDEVLKEPGTAKKDTPFWTEYVEPFKALITANGQDVDDDRNKWDYSHITSRASAIWVWDHALTLDEGYDDLWNNYIEPRRQHLFGKHAETNTAVATGYDKDLKAGIPAKQSAITDLKAKVGYELIDGGIKITNANDETIDISGWQLGGPIAMTIPNGTVLDAKQGDTNGEVYFVTNRIAYCTENANALTDQVIVGNAAAGKPETDVSLIATDGTDIFYVPPTNQDHLRFLEIYGNTKDGAKGDTGEYFVLTNVSTELTVSLKGLQIFIGKTEDCEASGPEAAKMKLALADGEVGPNGTATFLQSDYTKDDGWEKITNGDLYLLLRTSAGSNAQKGYTSNKLYSECDGGGASLIAKTFGMTIQATTNDWRSSFDEPEPPPEPEPEGGVISGDYPDGTNITLTAAATIRIGNAAFGKAIAISGADATIELQEGTTATAPAITASGALTFGGTGSLVMSNDEQLVTCAGLTITNGTVKFTYTGEVAESRAIELKGDYIQNGGTVTMDIVSTNEVYGFWTETKKKVVRILGGTFNTTIDGGEKSATFKLEKGSNDVTLGGGAVNVTLKGNAPRFVQTKAKINLTGATVKIGGDALDARVFKSVETMTISGGVIKGEATGAGSEIFSADDDIRVEGGVVCVTAGDDAFSAQTNITISAGKVQALSTAGDGLDSNGDITISGGYVLANAKAEGCEGIEADGKLVISGGTVVAVGCENAIHLPDVGSVACYTNASVKYGKKYVEVAGTNDTNKTVTTVNLKDKCASKFSLIATCPGFIGEVTYTNDKPNKDLDYIDKLDDDLDGAFITTLDIVKPGETPEMEAETEEEAKEEIKKYEPTLTQEDVDAGVEKDMLKMEAVAITNETGAVTGYKAVVAVNPEVVPAPTVGEDGEVEPIVITPDGEGKTEVSVGIVNATKGLWYGYEVCNALGEGFANDVPSFERATGEAITITGSKRDGASSFFRVKVLPAKPTE